MGRVTASQAARFIPAGAGNTWVFLYLLLNTTVYPRWRGEHASAPFPCRYTLRFIPAGAGNTRRPYLSPRDPAVYPRWRGEHQRIRSAHDACAGLSPLARGTPCINWCTRWWLTVYPRWRGEHDQQCIGNNACCGLSPLARGTHHLGLHRSVPDRFIPAGAGNTTISMNSCTPITVYPRWRGEHHRAAVS